MVSGDSDNIAGLSVSLKFSLYYAKINGNKVLFIYRPIYFPRIFERIKIHPLKKRHAIFDLNSPYIDSSPSLLIRNVVGHLMGAYCFTIFLMNLLMYKLGIYDEILSYPRYIFGPNNLFNLEFYRREKNISIRNVLEEDYQVDLPVKLKKNCEGLLSELGVTRKKYVCLHIRTTHYKGTLDKENNGFRNAKPETYIPAIRYLVSKGLTVVRLGDAVQNLIPPIDGYVDYANSPFKSEEMDIYLIKNCYFYFGTNSGIYDLAVLLGVPMLTVNVTEVMAAKPFNRRDVMIYKRIKRIGDVEPLPFKNYLNMSTPVSLDTFEFVDNSPDDLIEAIDQILYNLSEEPKGNEEIDDEFEEMIRSASLRWSSLIHIPNSKATYNTGKDEGDRIFSYQNYYGKAGRSFIRRYYK